MNNLDTLLDTLQHQQAHIADTQAFTNQIMRHVDAATSPNTTLHPWWNAPLRAAASVALVLLLGLFVTLHSRPALASDKAVCRLHNIEKYQLDLSQLPPDASPRELYESYVEGKQEQTYYHNALIKYIHENF